MKYKDFTFKDDKILCWRLGPINSVRQKHFSRDVSVNGLEGTHKPPESRGMWAFPYPYLELFFVWHRWESLLPKKFRIDLPIDQYTDEYRKEKEILLKRIRRDNKPSLFYAKGFYSHFFPNGRNDYDDWFFWESPREWANVARKNLFVFIRTDDGVFKSNYVKDGFELFIP